MVLRLLLLLVLPLVLVVVLLVLILLILSLLILVVCVLVHFAVGMTGCGVVVDWVAAVGVVGVCRCCCAIDAV